MTAFRPALKWKKRQILQIWLFSTLSNPQIMTGALCSPLKILFLDTPLAYFLLLWFGGRRHRGQQGQLGEEDQEGCWH